MPGTHPRTLLTRLALRHRDLPRSLRRLWSHQRCAHEAVDLCDDLLAELDLLISLCVDAIEQGLDVADIADDALALKRSVYDQLIAFCSVRAQPLAEVLERSMLRDLTDSHDRIRVARARASRPNRPRASAPAQRLTPGWCA